jgi:hypothetical protein
MKVLWLALAMATALPGVPRVALGQAPPPVATDTAAPPEPAADEGDTAPNAGDAPPAAANGSASASPSSESAVASSTRFDPSTGAVGRPDQARGWDEPPGIEDEDVALFVPRAVLLLPELVLSVVFWLPEQGFKLVDRYRLVERAERILYFDDAHTAGWMPIHPGLSRVVQQ